MQWMLYSFFGSTTLTGHLPQGLHNPWRFAGKREVSDLSLFTHRFYNPQLMGWQTTDPLGFEEGLNLYTYVRNNPFYYKDPDGQIVFAIPLIVGTFGAAGITFGLPSAAAFGTALAYSAAGIALGWGSYQGYKWIDNQMNQVEENDHPDEKRDDHQTHDNTKKKPRFCGRELGNDPKKRPAEGFEWKGKGGPDTGRGSWVRDLQKPTEVTLHPDLEHKAPVGPHWDYDGPDGKARLNPDGSWEWKK